MSESELKRCPFCGGEAEMIEDLRDAPICYYHVRCTACRGDQIIGRRGAIELWNTRASASIQCSCTYLGLPQTAYCPPLGVEICTICYQPLPEPPQQKIEKECHEVL